MRKYKKMIALVLLVAAVGVVITGCTGAPPPEGGESEGELETPESNEQEPAENNGVDSGGDINGHIEIPEDNSVFV